MGETVSFEAAIDARVESNVPEISTELDVLQAKKQSSEYRNSVGKAIEDDPLTPLIEANADVLVRCPWMSDQTVTLSEAVIAYSEEVALITTENIHTVASVMLELLAARTDEAEESPEENEPPEEEEVKPVAKDSATEEDRQESKVEPVPQNEEKNTEIEKKPDNVPAPGLKTSHRHTPEVEHQKGSTGHSAPKKLSHKAEQQPVAAPPESQTVRRPSPHSKGEPRIQMIQAAQEGWASQPPAAAEAEDRLLISEALKADVEAAFVEEEPPEDGQPLAHHDSGQSQSDEAEPKLLVLDKIQAEIDPENAAQITAKKDEENRTVVEDISDELYIQAEASDFSIILEESEDEAIYFIPPEEVSVLDDDANLERENILTPQLAAEAEDGFKSSVQDSSQHEEVEALLAQTAESAFADQPETAEAMDKLLDEIIKVPEKIERNLITDDEAEEELAGLFAELFDHMGIDYSIGSIEPLARLTLKLDLIDEIKPLKSEEGDEAPQDTGTHEFIKKLLVGLTTIKKAATHAAAIGKSALRLYSFSLAYLS